jgi:hypothetical protein
VPWLTAAATVLAPAGPVFATSANPPASGSAGTSFSTSFETGQPQPTWTSTVETGPEGTPRCSGVVQSGASGAPAGLATTVGSGPATAYAAKTDVGFTGRQGLRLLR